MTPDTAIRAFLDEEPADVVSSFIIFACGKRDSVDEFGSDSLVDKTVLTALR